MMDTSKKRRITIHGQEVTDKDWRGILAVFTTIGYFLIITIAFLRYDPPQILATIGLLSTPEMLVLSWYFRAKEASK